MIRPSSRRARRLAAALALAALPACTLAAPAAAAPALQEVMFVGNNWDGTADVIHSCGTFAKLGRIDVVQDRAERMAEINSDLVKLVYFLASAAAPARATTSSSTT